MSFQTKLTSMQMRRATPPEETTVVLTWKVRYVVNGVETNWNPVTHWITLQSVLPETGEKMTGYVPNTAATDWSQRFRCRTIEYRFLDESQRVWEATAQFSSKDAWCPHPTVYRTDQTQTRSVEMYRDVYPTSTMLNSTAAQHTVQTGNRIDDKGKPVPRDLPQQALNVSFIWNTSIESSTGNGYPNIAALISEGWLDGRNDAEFLGFPIGTVRLVGCSIDPDRDEYVRVTYQFVYDPWGFMVQEAALAADGKPELETTGTVVNAKTVYWKQTILSLVDFSELFGTVEYDWLLKGWVTYDETTCTYPEAAASYGKAANDAQVGSVSGHREYPVEAVP